MPNLALAESEVRTLVDYLEAEDSTARPLRRLFRLRRCSSPR